MSVPTLNLSISRGVVYTLPAITAVVDGVTDFTGYVPQAHIKYHVYDTTPAALFDLSITAGGEITGSLSAASSAALFDTVYQWDLRVKNGDDTYYIRQGTVTVTTPVTIEAVLPTSDLTTVVTFIDGDGVQNKITIESGVVTKWEKG